MVAAAGGEVGAEAARIWTDGEGRTVEGVPLEVQDDRLLMRRAADGAAFAVPLERLSRADRGWVAGWVAASDWPGRTAVTGVRVEVELESANESRYRTENFVFEADARLSRMVVGNFGALFEGTLVAVDALPLGLGAAPGAEPYRTMLFATREAYLASGGRPDAAAIYRQTDRRILVPLERLGVRRTSSGFSYDRRGDNRLLVHEITHQVMHDWLNVLPIWLVEGLAVYMEFVPQQGGRFDFRGINLRESLAGRMGLLTVRDLELVGPERLFAVSKAGWDAALENDSEVAARLYLSSGVLTWYFLHHDGDRKGERLREAIQAVRRPGGRFDVSLLVPDGDEEALKEAVRRACRAEGLRVSFVDEPVP
ncbi:MAG: hypothetical protein EA425_15325 [Puniceicoccaceae bacterium]|nr:MAG: hypothetical protein EA425_15325 [Puniceicoccaceae bacterium]